MVPYAEQPHENSMGSVLQILLTSIESIVCLFIFRNFKFKFKTENKNKKGLRHTGQYVGSADLWSTASARLLSLPGGYHDINYIIIYIYLFNSIILIITTPLQYRVRSALHLHEHSSTTSAESDAPIEARRVEWHDELTPTSPGWPLSLQRVMRRCWLSEPASTRLQVIKICLNSSHF